MESQLINGSGCGTVVALLAERLLSPPEDQGLNPDINTFY